MLSHPNKSSVSCTVGTCAYHGPNNQCTAGSINVGTEYALDKTETFCSTYTNKAH
ncbi:MAG: DUF1540 domain-containing protein [Oscillospiraceae bacterium]|jgi:hypothetical protein|nr:DUF1540 domain-containing protein [Oscillospiraceae bacterium]